MRIFYTHHISCDKAPAALAMPAIEEVKANIPPIIKERIIMRGPAMQKVD